MLNKIKGQNFIFKFVASYITILIIPIAISSIAYTNAYKAVEESTQRAMYFSLEQAKSVLEQRFDEIDSMTYQLNKNTFARRFSAEQGGISGEVPSMLLEVQNKLPDYRISNKFIMDYFILFPKTQIALNKSIVYSYESFYKDYLSYDKMNYEEWLAQINGEAGADMYWKNQLISIADQNHGTNLPFKRELSAMTCFLSRGKSYDTDMSVMMLVSTTEIEKIISSNVQSSKDYVGIIDSNNGLLYETNTHDAYSEYSITLKNRANLPNTYTDYIKGQKVFVTYSHSEKMNWSYVSIKPYETVMASLIAVQKSIIVVTALSFLIGIAVAIVLSVRKNAPAMLLVNNNQKLQYQLEANKPIMENSFIERLLAGVLSDNDLRETLNYLNIKEISDYRAFIFQFYDSEKLDIEYFEKIKLVTESIIIEKNIEKTYFHDIGAFKIAFIADCHDWNFELGSTKQCIEDICFKLQALFPCKIAVSVGNIYQNIAQIQLSVQDALWLLDNKVWDKSFQIIFTQDFLQTDTTLRGEFDLQRELIQLQNCIKGGFDTEIAIIFDHIRSNLLQDHGDGGQSSGFLFIFTMLNFLEDSISLHFQENFQFEHKIQAVGKDVLNYSLSDNLHQIKKLCIEITKLFSLYNTEKKENVFEKIIVYIKENYADSMLSLTMIAEQSGISESYLSRQFKKYIGENISGYIENVRLEKAAELLIGNKALNVQQIAQEVGYNSPNTFNKAFNKKYGISPSAYRNMQK